MPKLSGFTLFKVPKGWQMSTRMVDEEGWEIQLVSDDIARELLATVNDYLRRTRSVAAYRPDEPPPSRSDGDPLGLRRARRRVLLD